MRRFQRLISFSLDSVHSCTRLLRAVGGTEEERTRVSGKVGCPCPLQWGETGLGPATLVTSVMCRWWVLVPPPAWPSCWEPPSAPTQSSGLILKIFAKFLIDWLLFHWLNIKKTYSPRSFVLKLVLEGFFSDWGTRNHPTHNRGSHGGPLTHAPKTGTTSFWSLPWILSLPSFSENILPSLNPRTNALCSLSFHLNSQLSWMGSGQNEYTYLHAYCNARWCYACRGKQTEIFHLYLTFWKSIWMKVLFFNPLGVKLYVIYIHLNIYPTYFSNLHVFWALCL